MFDFKRLQQYPNHNLQKSGQITSITSILVHCCTLCDNDFGHKQLLTSQSSVIIFKISKVRSLCQRTQVRSFSNQRHFQGNLCNLLLVNVYSKGWKSERGSRGALSMQHIAYIFSPFIMRFIYCSPKKKNCTTMFFLSEV